MASLNKTILDIYALDSIKRYNGKPVLFQETVASHSYMVTMIVMELHKLYQFDLFSAMKMALVHDLPEVHVSDIPYPLKAANPGLSKIMADMEAEYIENNYPEHYELFLNYAAGESVESLIVNLADAKSVYTFCRREREAGNLHISDIETSLAKRFKVLEVALSQYIRM